MPRAKKLGAFCVVYWSDGFATALAGLFPLFFGNPVLLIFFILYLKNAFFQGVLHIFHGLFDFLLQKSLQQP